VQKMDKFFANRIYLETEMNDRQEQLGFLFALTSDNSYQGCAIGFFQRQKCMSVHFLLMC
jgi:hypothetical protein